jgi:hypothetical protein
MKRFKKQFKELQDRALSEAFKMQEDPSQPEIEPEGDDLEAAKNKKLAVMINLLEQDEKMLVEDNDIMLKSLFEKT